jgi:hypothetical protein
MQAFRPSPRIAMKYLSPTRSALPAAFNRLAWSNLAAQSAEQVGLAATPPDDRHRRFSRRSAARVHRSHTGAGEGESVHRPIRNSGLSQNTTFPIAYQRQALLWGALALGLVALMWVLRPVLTPFLLGALIAYMLQPGVEWLARHRVPRGLAALPISTPLPDRPCIRARPPATDVSRFSPPPCVSDRAPATR